MFNKKAISPVVATALLLVVAVVAVVGFQGWYQTFSSNLFVSAEQDSGNLDTSGIEGVIGDTLYLKAGDNLTIESVRIDGNDCNINGTYSGTLGFDVSSCLSQISSSTPEIVMVTGDKILSKKVYLDLSSLSLTAPQCYDPANVNTTGNWSGCVGMLIVNNSMLESGGSSPFTFESDGSYQIEFEGINYTYGDSQYNIFTGQVTELIYTFYNGNFNSSINYWDVSNVSSFDGVFADATSFNQPLNNWDTSSGISFNTLFSGATSFNQPLNSWDISSATDISNMFSDASNFNQSLDSWSVSNVEFAQNVFSQATSFNQPLNSWDVSNVVSMSSMFRGATSFNQPLDSWNVSNVTTMTSLFRDASNFNQNISSWCVENIASEPTWFDINSGFDGNLALQPNWNVTC